MIGRILLTGKERNEFGGVLLGIYDGPASGKWIRRISDLREMLSAVSFRLFPLGRRIPSFRKSRNLGNPSSGSERALFGKSASQSGPIPPRCSSRCSLL